MKLDNKPYDRGLIAIYEDFEICPVTGDYFDMNTGKVYTKESIMWHLSMSQEAVDDIVWSICND